MERISYEKLVNDKKKGKTVFGDPIPFSTFTIIPVARVKYSHTEDDPDERMPLGYIEIKGDNTRFISFYDPTEMLLLGSLSGMGIASVMALLRKVIQRPDGKGGDISQGDECPNRDFKKVLTVVGATLGMVSLALTLGKVFSKSKNPVGDITSFITETFLSTGKKAEPANPPLDADKEKLWKNATRVDIDETPETMKG